MEIAIAKLSDDIEVLGIFMVGFGRKNILVLHVTLEENLIFHCIPLVAIH